VTKDVGADPFPVQGRSLPGGNGCVRAHAPFDGVSAQPPAGAGWEQRVLGSSAAFARPFAQHRLDGAGEGDGSLSAAFALTADVGSDAQADVAAVEPGDLGDSQPGLGGEED
jgi:hypothetical protein